MFTYVYITKIASITSRKSTQRGSKNSSQSILNIKTYDLRDRTGTIHCEFNFKLILQINSRHPSETVSRFIRRQHGDHTASKTNRVRPSWHFVYLCNTVTNENFFKMVSDNKRLATNLRIQR